MRMDQIIFLLIVYFRGYYYRIAWLLGWKEQRHQNWEQEQGLVSNTLEHHVMTKAGL